VGGGRTGFDLGDGDAADHLVTITQREQVEPGVVAGNHNLHAVQVATVNVKAQITGADQQRVIDEYAAALENAR